MSHFSPIAQHQSGVSTVELIIVLIVAGLFAISSFQLIASINDVAGSATLRSRASNLAYNNLRQFANGTQPLWFECIGDIAAERPPTYSGATSDAKSVPSSTGQVLLNTSTNVAGLPGTVIQKVIAIAPYGCGDSGTGMPIRIQSQVQYGNPQRTITHATYASY